MAVSRHLVDAIVADGETLRTELVTAGDQVVGVGELRRVGSEFRSVATASFTGERATISAVRVHFRQGPVDFPLDDGVDMRSGETFTSGLVVGNA